METTAEPYGPLAHFLPLADNTVYSYHTVDEETGETGLFVIRVRHATSGLVELTVGGNRHWLEPTPRAVRHTGGGSLLRMPLVAGSTWKGPAGIVELTAIGRRVDVPAGTFHGCIQTTEESAIGETSQRIVTDYCPEVGIARLAIESTVSTTRRREVAELQDWGPQLDWGDDGITITK